MTNTDVMVEGEPAQLILSGLRDLMEGGRVVNGMYTVEGVLQGDSGAAVIHAIGRIDAELAAADMRSFLPGHKPVRRTDSQRRHDAFQILVERVTKAMM